MINQRAHKQTLVKVRNGVLNGLHAIMLLSLLVYTLHGIFYEAGISSGHFFEDLWYGLLHTGATEIFTFVGCIAFITFGIIGIYEFAYSHDMTLLYPPKYGKLRKKRDAKNAEIMMRTYYENDKQFLQNYEFERFSRVLQALKIDVPQYRILSYDLLRARSMQDDTIEQLKEKAEKTVINRAFIEDLSNVPPDERVYTAVDYFVNLYAAVYIEQMQKDLGAIMAQYINLTMKLELQELDYIVIPRNSNLLLGLDVGKRLGKKIVYIQSEPRIFKNKLWDGEYECKPGHTNHIIILHDVLVSGDRIVESVQKLTPGTYIIEALFCFIKYDLTNYTPDIKLKEINIGPEKTHCLLTTCEDQLKEKLNDEK